MPLELVSAMLGNALSLLIASCQLAPHLFPFDRAGRFRADVIDVAASDQLNNMLLRIFIDGVSTVSDSIAQLATA